MSESAVRTAVRVGFAGRVASAKAGLVGLTTTVSSSLPEGTNRAGIWTAIERFCVTLAVLEFDLRTLEFEADVRQSLALVIHAFVDVAGDFSDAFGDLTRLPKLADQLAKSFSSQPIGSATGARFLSPVANPTKIIAAPVNYEAHVAEAREDRSTFPQSLDIKSAGLFLKASSSLVGASEGVRLGFADRRSDHEIELVAIIGRQARNVSAGEALDYVAGYCIGLDMTVRGTEDRSFRKSVDTYTVLGPWLVTPDDINDPNALQMQIKVNGIVRQRSSTNNMIVSVRQLIAWASEWYTLDPGDVIMTGTPQGVGPVIPGDVMDCEIESIGSMMVGVR